MYQNLAYSIHSFMCIELDKIVAVIYKDKKFKYLSVFKTDLRTTESVK